MGYRDYGIDEVIKLKERPKKDEEEKYNRPIYFMEGVVISFMV